MEYPRWCIRLQMHVLLNHQSHTRYSQTFIQASGLLCVIDNWVKHTFVTFRPLEDVTTTLPRNIGKQLPSEAAL